MSLLLKWSQKATIFFIFVAIFAINLPTRFMDASLFFLLIFWLFSGNYNNKYQRIKSNPGAVAAIILFLSIGLSTFYVSIDWLSSLSGWLRYHGLLLIPIIVSVVDKNKYRDYAINIFIFSSLLVLFISYMKWLGIIPIDFIRSEGPRYVVFRHSISQNIFMAFATYLMLDKFRLAKDYMQYVWSFLLAASIFNIFILVDSRSGQIALVLTSLLFLYHNWKATYLRYLIVFSFLIFAAFQSKTFTNLKIFNVKNEILMAQAQIQVTSSGQRLELWTNTLQLIKRHPFFGGGAGSLEYEYKKYIPEEQIIQEKKFANPHSHFILMLQEVGVVGLGIFLLFWFAHWRIASRLTNKSYRLALKGLILLFITTSLFNCMYWGGEGKLYYLITGILLSAYKANQKTLKGILIL